MRTGFHIHFYREMWLQVSFSSCLAYHCTPIPCFIVWDMPSTWWICFIVYFQHFFDSIEPWIWNVHEYFLTFGTKHIELSYYADLLMCPFTHWITVMSRPKKSDSQILTSFCGKSDKITVNILSHIKCCITLHGVQCSLNATCGALIWPSPQSSTTQATLSFYPLTFN